MPDLNQTIGIVVIGRNEGQRLHSCLRSVAGKGAIAVYVDSGSVDGSSAFAASVGCSVLQLEPARPFSAARARNEGFSHLLAMLPSVSLVQFLDGDCEMMEGWLSTAVATLGRRPDVAIVCGNVRERYPETSAYNLLCDLEWQTKPGEVRTSGGRFMVRAEVFQAVGGFRADVIAAEDDEFCLRVRGLGWKILQVDAPMGLHDAAMMRFTEWWRRAKRCGHAYAQGSAMHGKSPERHFVRDCRRIWVWGLAVPLLALAAAFFTHGLSLLLLLAYPLLAARIYRTGRKRHWSHRAALIYAFFTVLSKFPALLGLLEYYWRSRSGRDLTIIEYKKSSLSA